MLMNGFNSLIGPRFLVAGALAILVTLTTGPGAHGQKAHEAEQFDPEMLESWDESKWTKVIQNRSFEKAQRHILTVYGGLVPNDDLHWLMPVGLRYGYLFTEMLGLEIEGAYLFSADTNLKGKLDKDADQFDPYRRLHWYVTANFYWYPIHGKMALLGSALGHFDIGLRAGIGAIGSKFHEFVGAGHKWSDDVDIMGNVGLVGMVYLSRHLALRLDFVVYLFDVSASNLTAPVELTLGLSVFPIPVGVQQ